MSKAGTVAWIAIFAAIFLATPIVEAQFSVPPQIGLAVNRWLLPMLCRSRSVAAEVNGPKSAFV